MCEMSSFSLCLFTSEPIHFLFHRSHWRPMNISDHYESRKINSSFKEHPGDTKRLPKETAQKWGVGVMLKHLKQQQKKPKQKTKPGPSRLILDYLGTITAAAGAYIDEEPPRADSDGARDARPAGYFLLLFQIPFRYAGRYFCLYLFFFFFRSWRMHVDYIPLSLSLCAIFSLCGNSIHIYLP